MISDSLIFSITKGQNNMQYYIVDAFADTLFKGNPAGVCLLNKWLDDEVMQSIAMENNLSETAFVVKRGGTLYCEHCGERVKISGKAVLYLQGEIKII